MGGGMTKREAQAEVSRTDREIEEQASAIEETERFMALDLEDAVNELVQAVVDGVQDDLTPMETLIVAMAQELVAQRGPDVFDQLARTQEKAARYRRALRRHERAVAWALGEAGSDFGDEQSKLTHMNGVPVPRYWWRRRLSEIARGSK